MAEDEPDVNHLDDRGGGQTLHLTDEDGGHHQHCGQVYTQGCLKKEGLEEGSGKGYSCQKNGREIGGHHLTCDLSFHQNFHPYPFFAFNKGCFDEVPFDNSKEYHIHFLAHNYLARD